MKYQYYPGCSLEGTAREYNVATQAVMARLGIDLVEIPDWTCCGASAAEPINPLLADALAGRNMALAEKDPDKADILAPCSACYLNLKRVREKIRADGQYLTQINSILNEVGLNMHPIIEVRHILDVLSRDIDLTDIQNQVRRSMDGLVIAPYYGCQCLRPFVEFDDPEEPVSMNGLIEATGARVLPWHMGGKCCGASHMNTKPDVGIELVSRILNAAEGADAIVTVCPMCQMNLEGFQKKASAHLHKQIQMTVLYLPQFLGLAFGMSESEMDIRSNLAVTNEFRARIGRDTKPE